MKFIKKIKSFLDWNYLIAFNENVIKGDNSKLGASLFVASDYMSILFIIFIIIHKFFIIDRKIGIFLILTFFILIVFINYFYYEILKNRKKIIYVQKTSDYRRKLSISFFLLLSFIVIMYFLYLKQ
jgi:hypothetical protein